MKKKPPDSILVVKTSSIGDVVLTTPVAEAIRKSYPNCRQDWLVEDKVADVLIGNPFVDNVVIWNRRQLRELRKAREWSAVREAVGELKTMVRQVRYDYCFDLQGFDRTLLAHTWISARRRVFLPGTDRLSGYTRHIWQRIPRVHATDYHLNVIRSSGLQIGDEAPPLYVPVPAEDEATAARLLGPLGSRPIVAFNPVTTWPSKVWPIERHRGVARSLIKEFGAGVIVVGGKGEAPTCTELAESIGPEALNLAGATSLKELAAVLKRCVCLVTSDSGPMHIAAAVGTPVVALFGPTHPANYGPRGDQHSIIYRSLSCSPCMNKCLVDPECMIGISEAEVTAEVRKKLARTFLPIDVLSS